MKLVLDERETALYEKITSITKNDNIIIEKCVLSLGDAILQTDDGKEIAIIERKSLHDLLASIKDGRYVEQSFRLQNCCNNNPHKIIYIIEGVFAQLRNPAQDKKTIFSSITTLNLFKGFSVLRTSSVQETAELLMAMADKTHRSLEKGSVLFSPSVKLDADTQEVVPTKKYCEVVKKVKKENLTPENMGEVILCQIPSINSVSAIAIMKEFISISKLIDSLKKNPECLDNIMCETKGKTRKISKAVVQNVKDFLLYNVD
jgi:ERCC4-type nuclease